MRGGGCGRYGVGVTVWAMRVRRGRGKFNKVSCARGG